MLAWISEKAKGFEASGTVPGDEVIAVALIDRLLHHCPEVNIHGNNCRMRAHRDLLGRRRRDEFDDRSQAT